MCYVVLNETSGTNHLFFCGVGAITFSGMGFIPRVSILFLVPGLHIKVCIGKLFSLFLIQNICCGYSKEPSQ